MFYKRQQRGKPVSAAIVNRGVEALERIEKITVAPGLNITNDASGIVISHGTSIPGRELGVSTSIISVASGVTPGSGTVDMYLPKWGGAAAVSINVSLTVYNWSTQKAVPTATNVMLCKIHGVWFVDWADCAS